MYKGDGPAQNPNSKRESAIQTTPLRGEEGWRWVLRPPYDIVKPNTSPDFSLDTKTGSRDLSDEEIVVAYHERTKHHYHRYAASLGYLDWAKQPDPFRRYDGAPLVRFLCPTRGRALPLLAALRSRTTWCRLRFRSTPSHSSFATHSR